MILNSSNTSRRSSSCRKNIRKKDSFLALNTNNNHKKRCVKSDTSLSVSDNVSYITQEESRSSSPSSSSTCSCSCSSCVSSDDDDASDMVTRATLILKCPSKTKSKKSILSKKNKKSSTKPSTVTPIVTSRSASARPVPQFYLNADTAGNDSRIENRRTSTPKSTSRHDSSNESSSTTAELPLYQFRKRSRSKSRSRSRTNSKSRSKSRQRQLTTPKKPEVICKYSDKKMYKRIDKIGENLNCRLNTYTTVALIILAICLLLILTLLYIYRAQQQLSQRARNRRFF